MIHIITAAGGPVTPVGIERAVEAVRGISHAAAVGVGPAGTQQIVVVVVPSVAPRRADLAPIALAARVRAAVAVDVAAVFVVPALPVDKRHNSKVDRTRVSRWAGAALAGGRITQTVNVVVTGASSLLGGAVARRLHDRGDHVTVFQRRPSGLGFTEVLGDVTDRRAVAAAVLGADVVIHAAAKVTVVGAWSEFAATNISGTANLVDAARAAGAADSSTSRRRRSRIRARRSSARPPVPPIRTRARDNYSRSKAAGELLALAAAADDFAVVAVRPHLVWGPGDTQLIGRIVERARQGRLAVIGSGAALVDTTYVVERG